MGRVGRLALILLLLSLYPLVRRVPWRTVWVVNAGTQDDVRHFGPVWLARRLEQLFTLVPTGFFHAPGVGLSLVVGTPLDNATLMQDREACRGLVERVTRLRAARIALNGVLPAALYSHALWPADTRLMREPLGTVHMIRGNLDEIQKRHPEALADGARVAVIGVGQTGSEVANDLARTGQAVLAFDTRPEAARRLADGVEFAGLDPRPLEEVGVAVFLTPRGDDAAQLVLDALPPGTVVLSDTHPKLSRHAAAELRTRGITVYESALTRPGTRFLPKLPRWPRDTIPGCVGQALVEAAHDCTFKSQEDFDRAAPQLLRARLDEP